MSLFGIIPRVQKDLPQTGSATGSLQDVRPLTQIATGTSGYSNRHEQMGSAIADGGNLQVAFQANALTSAESVVARDMSAFQARGISRYLQGPLQPAACAGALDRGVQEAVKPPFLRRRC